MAAWYLGGRQRWLFLSLGAAITCLIGWLRMAQGALYDRCDWVGATRVVDCPLAFDCIIRYRI